MDIQSSLPDIPDVCQWSKLLAGLDFRISFTIGDYMRIVQFLNSNEAMENDGNPCSTDVPRMERYKIVKALHETFVSGTASGRLKPTQDTCNYRVLEDWNKRKSSEQPTDMWGKTATIIDGTNKPLSYGLFIGGSGTTGIVAVLRKANGHVTARWAEMVLSRFLVK
jgi:hypothetical protein